MAKRILLNIPRKPIQGSSWIIKNILTNELCKCSLTSPNDGDMYQNHFYKGYFTVRVGSKHTSVTYLRFTINTSQCTDTTNSWIWMDLTQAEADYRKILYSEPNKISRTVDESFSILPETSFKAFQEIL